MEQEYECTKIMDGLYIGNIVACHDYEALVINKFGYVVNCTSEIPNIFENDNIKYLKFKLIEGKPHKLWDHTLKKLKKLEVFLEQAQQVSMCCLIHSFHGENRSLVFAAAYLMKKFQWKLKKTLHYLQSKQIYIGLSDHYIHQLQNLELILEEQSVLSQLWSPPYLNQEEEIISKTFINTNFDKNTGKGNGGRNHKEILKSVKKTKRIVWLDQLQSEQCKQEDKMKNQDKKRQSQEKLSFYHKEGKKEVQTFDENQTSKLKKLFSSGKMNVKEDDRELSSKKGIRKKKRQTLDHSSECDKNVYKLTINNFIQPSFNVISQTEPLLNKSRKKENKNSEENGKPINNVYKKSQKVTRAQSEKEGLTPLTTSQSRVTSSKVEKKNGLKRDIKKQLKKELEKIEKDKSSHSLNNFHSFYPPKATSNEVNKRNAGLTPTKRREKKNK